MRLSRCNIDVEGMQTVRIDGEDYKKHEIHFERFLIYSFVVEGLESFCQKAI